ncbi:MAG: hypothetical protein AVDCRST_MAG77-5934 [uncultured Chloroflexi bacterium]|uniref:Uncharacterized protein n=1 Tax=uncultured Chloroflexota bacterium TaxID=166587 RepID=A0A6J4KGL2_9CHLR|nr:MAG: hypothetical protein AVDCRST_MAG77-5934 [uncultured Chloroflexota bacterium]
MLTQGNAPNAHQHAPSVVHFHVNAVAMHGGAVETVHATHTNALATGRRLAVEARPGQGRIRWHADGFTTSYYVYDVAGRLATWVVVSEPCVGEHAAEVQA